MYVSDFNIPLNREELLNSSAAGQLGIREEFSIEELRERLEAANTALNEEGTDFIIYHFTTYFWLLEKFKQCSHLIRDKAWQTINKGFALLSKNTQVLLADPTNIDPYIQNRMCNITKMIVYALIELMKVNQNQFVTRQTALNLDTKSKKKQPKISSEEGDWNEKKHSVLVEMHTFLQYPLKLLWEPPIVEEEFINLIANFCYMCLEDPNINSSGTKNLRATIFQILGILIKNYLHGLSFCVKVVQLLRMNDHLVNALSQGIIQLVKECGCSNIVKEIVREIADTDGDQLSVDVTGTRSLNLFLVQLAESIPETIIPAIDLLVFHLNRDPYSMRICIVGVLGEIVLTLLTKENLDEGMKKMRDEYLECLEEHIHDVNAFVRTKVLQIWQKLCLGKAIPISRINRLLKLIIGRLNDKSTNVKKQAVHLIKDLLEGNPFCGQLNSSEIQSQLQQEKAKLESIEKEHNLNDNFLLWGEIEPKLKALLKEDASEEMEGCERGETSVDDVLSLVGNYLKSGELRKAVTIIKMLEEEFYETFELQKEDVCPETMMTILHLIFKQSAKAPLANASREIQDKVEKCCTTIEYLENALEFSQLIDRALPIILTFLDSNVVTDVLEAIHFFTAAYLFGFKQAFEGVRKMLYLVFSKEENVKFAVSKAYKELYFQQNGTVRQQSLETVKNLSELVLKLNFGQLDALEEVVKEWVKSDTIDKNCVQVLFEKFTRKLPDTRRDQCWASLVLIRMIGAAEAKIIKCNFPLLIEEGLKRQGSTNFLFAKETCKALHHLLPAKEQGKTFDHTLRYPEDHDLFRALRDLLKTGIWRSEDPYYIPMAEEAISLVFAICDCPDRFSRDLILDLHEVILKGKPSAKNKPATGNILNRANNEIMFDDEEEKENKEPENDKEELEVVEENPDELFITVLTRFISVLGQVTASYILFLEGPVLDELKLRNQLEYERKLKKLEETKKFNVSVKKSRKGAAENGIEKNLNETSIEDLEFNRVAADDMDAEEMRKTTEKTVVTGEGFLAKFAPLVVTICKNPGKYNNRALQNAAMLTLSKFMMVSSVFCEENLQLLVTICEKSSCPERQENGIVALGALQYRFPNILEPWTSHMFATLENPNPSVRYSSILVITDLIVNEMIKVRTHISNLALCVIDKDIKVARVARHFFREFSQKGNSLYNVLPNLISNLTQANSPVSSGDFKTIMKYILALVTKDKQSEYLVEKLCHYFESATTERQWCDVAYCLSLLNYNDKGLKKILENAKCFANKLYLSEVYEAFSTIVSDAGRNFQKDKSLVSELAAIVKQNREKSCEDKSGCTSNKDFTSTAKKRVARRKYLPSDSEDEEFDRKQWKRKNDSDKNSEGEDDGGATDGFSKRVGIGRKASKTAGYLKK